MLAGRATLACKHRVADAFLASSSSPRCAPRSTFRQFLNCGIAKLRASLREFRAFYYQTTGFPVLPTDTRLTRVLSNTFLPLPLPLPLMRNKFITRISLVLLRKDVEKDTSLLSFSRCKTIFPLSVIFLQSAIVKFISWILEKN